jgi:hypothetical protein
MAFRLTLQAIFATVHVLPVCRAKWVFLSGFRVCIKRRKRAAFTLTLRRAQQENVHFVPLMPNFIAAGAER